MAGKEDSAGGLFDGLPAAEEHGSAAPKSQAVPQAWETCHDPTLHSPKLT